MADADNDSTSSSSSTSSINAVEADSTYYNIHQAKRPRLVHFRSPLAEVVGTSGDEPSPTPVTSSEAVATVERLETELLGPTSNEIVGDSGAVGPLEVHEAPAEVDLMTLHQADLGGGGSDNVSMSSAPGELDESALEMSLALFSDTAANGMGGSTPSLPSLSSVETIPDCLDTTIRRLEGSLSLGSLTDEIQNPDITSGDVSSTSESTSGSVVPNPRGDGPFPEPQDQDP